MGKDCCGQRRYLRRAEQDAAEVLVSANPSFRGQIHTFPVSRFASVSSSPQNDPVSSHASLALQEPILSFFNPSQLRSNLISSFGHLSSPKPRSGLTGLRWRIAAKKVHWHGHEILRRLRSFRKLRQPRGLKRFERRQFSLGIDWESDLVVMGGCFPG